MSDAKSSTGEIPREHKIEMGIIMEKKLKSIYYLVSEQTKYRNMRYATKLWQEKRQQ
ncbi:MAG: hypothetical protein II243_03325 [Lachnospiraceae bacterium]|nr:hypothetical protein [Lachnospiraceae bacterium]